MNASGRLERVMVLDDGYAWNGCVYRSLSQVAKAITGTNWNGHRLINYPIATISYSLALRSKGSAWLLMR